MPRAVVTARIPEAGVDELAVVVGGDLLSVNDKPTGRLGHDTRLAGSRHRKAGYRWST